MRNRADYQVWTFFRTQRGGACLCTQKTNMSKPWGLCLRQTSRYEQGKRHFGSFNPMASWTQKVLFLTYTNKNMEGV